MKARPSWQHAPEWAEFLACDNDGHWWWYESRPHVEIASGRWISGGVSERACNDWWETLEERP